MSDQPKALRMADELDGLGSQYDSEIAAELRRLHDLVTEDSILLRRQRDEIAQLGQALARAIERNNELEAELAEQARVNGMGGEREARLMALNTELVETLRMARDELDGLPHSLGYAFTHIPKIDAALAKATTQGEVK